MEKIVKDKHALETEINGLENECGRLRDLKEKFRDSLEIIQPISTSVDFIENPIETVKDSQTDIYYQREEKIEDNKKTRVNQFCPYCGASVKGLRFCGQCGKKVN